MSATNDVWIRSLINNSKIFTIFVMLIIAISTANAVGFLLYFCGYQLSSVVRLVVYTIVFPQANAGIYDTVDYIDFASFITDNKIPYTIISSLYAMAYTLPFLTYTLPTQVYSMPQIYLVLMLVMLMIVYIATINMMNVKGTNISKIMPYIEIVAGFATGYFCNYVIYKSYRSALFFNPNRKVLVRRCVAKPIVIPSPTPPV